MSSFFALVVLCNVYFINSQILGIDTPITAGYSELITVITQGEWTTAIDNVQSNCPFNSGGLTTWTYGSSSDVTITSGSNILLTAASISGNTESNTFNRIEIQSGASLIFNDEDITLHVREILNFGTLQIGSSTCRILNNIQIIFYGDTSDSSLSNGDRAITSKGIISDGNNAILDIHGKQYHPTWTRLALLSNVSDTIITLQDEVNWEVGQEIMITTTIWYDCPDFYEFEWCLQCFQWEKSSYPGPPTNGSGDYCYLHNLRHHENEVRKIINVDSGNKILTLNDSLNYEHYAGKEYQAEVVLLSRNILLEGNMDDGTSFADGYGGHTLATGSSTVRISGTQANHMGQLNVLGRYPFHMHLLGNGIPSYFQDNSVTNSFFRCYVVHGTNNTLLTRNTAFNAMGHCYYIEDGVEEENTLSYNFAGHVHPIYKPSDGSGQNGENHITIAGYGYESLAIPVDTSAAGFYISNAYNNIIGNAASGGWSGFAFPNIPYPIGEYFAIGSQGNRNPENRPTLVFNGNSAHSSGFYWRDHGSCIYCGAELLQTGEDPPTWSYTSGRNDRDTKDPNGDFQWMKYHNTKTFLCQRGVTHWGNMIELYNYETYDIHRGAEIFGESGISDAIMCGHSGNERGFLSTCGTIYPNNERNGFRGYDTSTKTILNNILFRNYKVNQYNVEVYDASEVINSYAYIYETGGNQFIPQNINAVNNISFEDCDQESRVWSDPAAWDSLSGKLYSVYDYSGSLAYSSDGKGPSILGSHVSFWNIDANECDLDPYSSLYRCDWDFDTRSQIYLEPYVSGLYDGSNLAGYISIWGDITRNITIGPNAGVAGISDIGWYWKPIVPSQPSTSDASPSFFDVGGKSHNRNGIVLASNHFVVLAMRYPNEASFDVRIKSTWWASLNVFGTNGVLPMSNLATVTSLDEGYTDPYNNPSWDCSDTSNGLCTNYGGAIGPAWYYDSVSEYLYIRIVNLNCYSAYNEWYLGCSDSYTTNSMYSYQRNFYQFQGLKLWNPRNNWYYEVNVTCSTCNVVYNDAGNDIDWFEIPDIGPPPCKLNNLRCTQPSQIPTQTPLNPGSPTRSPVLNPTESPPSNPTMSPEDSTVLSTMLFTESTETLEITQTIDIIDSANIPKTFKSIIFVICTVVFFLL